MKETDQSKATEASTVAHTDTDKPTEDGKSEKSGKSGTLLKRLGFLGFMFFLIKGLLWLIIPALAYFGYGWSTGE